MEITKRIATLSPEKRELLIRSLQNKTTATSASAIRVRPRTSDRAPCSFPQQRLWFLQQLEPSSCAYNMPGVLHLNGPFNEAAMALAMIAPCTSRLCARASIRPARNCER